jgi:hypothetical protein
MKVYNSRQLEYLTKGINAWKKLPGFNSYFEGLEYQDELNLSILLTNQSKYLSQLGSKQLKDLEPDKPADILEKVCKGYLDLIKKFPKNVFALPTVAVSIEYINKTGRPVETSIVSELQPIGPHTNISLTESIQERWQELYNEDNTKDLSKFYILILLLKVPAGQAAKVDSWYGKLLYVDESDPIEVVEPKIEPVEIPEIVETPEILKLD